MRTSLHFLCSRRAAQSATEVIKLAASLRLHRKSSTEERDASYTTYKYTPKTPICSLLVSFEHFHSCSGGKRPVACTIDFSFSQQSNGRRHTYENTQTDRGGLFSSLFVPVCTLSPRANNTNRVTLIY